MQKLKEMWQNLSAKSKKLLGIIAGITVVVIAVAVFLLARGQKTEYQTLFSSLSQGEAQQIVSLLQEQNVPYLYDGKSGALKVPSESVDTLRAQLLSKGYPKSGFAYDMYIGNSGLMTTESDKKQYTLYDLQDRLGATIRLFDGVRDAKVTIAEGTDQTYAIEEDNPVQASASVVVTMEEGQSLSEKNAEAIKNLIARSVKGMNFTNVSVFDAGTMEEVAADAGDSASGSGTSMANLTTTVENNIANNIKRVLGKIYGGENLAVSVKGTLNMAKLIQENTQYTVPEKTEATDKRGLLSNEEVAGENAGNSGENAAGVAGADANADTPRYTTQNGTATTTDNYSNSSATREWLYNVLKEQKEIAPGVLEDASVAIVINTDDNSIPESDLINLVADAAGIKRDEAADKITILRSLNKTAVQQTTEEKKPAEEPKTLLNQFPLWALIGAAVSAFLLILILLILILRGRKKKKLKKLAQEEMENAAALSIEQPTDEITPVEEVDEDELTAEGKMAHGMKLKKSIGEFTDQNPQVVAKLIQSWMREEEQNLGRKQHRSTRKTS
ncbi:flagellar M-ring protein FliF [Oribacterium sinus]|uniref:Flagellar M-ring protein FliF n=1 Tax=Oribacterium sinus TaxID=237576 RepID=A0A7W9SEG6_9FIRM|nr:flagellar basal-body MS-ring/collar protein FliF [Oribacterium sinus]MBB6040664.1 flagellar M-ring protein FliF [Oribacterium sinus]MBF1272091.1 flagellar M-ring protein FliF [Oribacterium sinus]